MLSKNRIIIISLFFYSLIIRVIILIISNPIIDDFFISLRVAKNFISGNGLVYNTGDKIISSTSNFYTLICAMFLYVFGDNAINVIRIFLMVVDSINTVLIFLIVINGLSKIKSQFDNNANLKISIIAALIYASIPTTISANIRGLETAIYIFFIALSFLFLQKDLLDWSFLSSSIAAIIRPDGFILTFILFITFVIWRKNIKYSLKGIVLLILYHLLLLIYYKQIVPQSVIAKSYLDIDHIANWVIFLFKFYLTPKVFLLGVLALLGNFIFLKSKYFYPIAIWGIAYAVIFSTFGYWYPWYMSPFTVYYAISISLGLKLLYDRIVIYSESYKKLIYLFYAIPFILLIQSYYNEIILGKNDSKVEISQKMKISDFINHNSKNSDIISVEALGMIGYHSINRKFIDLHGLISKAVTEIWKANNIKVQPNFADTSAARIFIQGIKPDLLCLREFEVDALNKTDILKNYDLNKRLEITNTERLRANHYLLN